MALGRGGCVVGEATMEVDGFGSRCLVGSDRTAEAEVEEGARGRRWLGEEVSGGRGCGL